MDKLITLAGAGVMSVLTEQNWSCENREGPLSGLPSKAVLLALLRLLFTVPPGSWPACARGCV